MDSLKKAIHDLERIVNPHPLKKAIDGLAKAMGVKKQRIYLKPGESAPAGANVQTGGRGGRYYETGVEEKPEVEPEVIGIEEISNYQKSFGDVLKKTESEFEGEFSGFKITSRLKSSESIKEKIHRKGYEKLDQIDDVAGMRVQTDTFDEIGDVVSKIRGDYNVVEEKDYRNHKPKDGYYRSYHLKIEREGKIIEIQVRTENQQKINEFAHNTIYKSFHLNLTGEQKESVTEFIINAADAYYNIDRGLGGVELECPAELSELVGCP